MSQKLTQWLAEIIERDRLFQALKTEQTNHAQTRRSLTSVIADTIDKMTQ